MDLLRQDPIYILLHLILQIIVDADRADTIFEWLHDRVELDSRYGAFMFQEELISAGTFTVPDAPEEEG